MLHTLFILVATFTVSFVGTWIVLELRDRFLKAQPRWTEDHDLLSW